jgi:predicted nuclease of restriction endonuclease-like (RecB) superfamily
MPLTTRYDIWSHNRVILDRCSDDLQREFSLRMTRRMGWSRNVLIHQIENRTYAKTLRNQANFAQILLKPLREQARLALKDDLQILNSVWHRLYA